MTQISLKEPVTKCGGVVCGTFQVDLLTCDTNALVCMCERGLGVIRLR